MIEGARAALRDQRNAEALRSAEVYVQRFPGGQFVPEMGYIRMEALDRLGDRDSAADAARSLITRHPSGPQRLRAQQILAREKM